MGDRERVTPTERPLPPFTVRRSSRARRVRLTVSARDGLVVTLPARVPAKAAEEAVRAQAAWAWRHLDATAERRAALAAAPEAQLPSVVELPALGRAWVVEYRETAARGVSVRESGSSLHVSGAIADAQACMQALRRWRDRAAREGLTALARECSSATGIRIERVSVRAQRSRWGSCSTRGTISLNRNLVFLPEELARYVVLHELAHVRERGHGPSFWSHLALLEPDALALRARMRGAGDLVPAWADA